MFEIKKINGMRISIRRTSIVRIEDITSSKIDGNCRIVCGKDIIYYTNDTYDTVIENYNNK